MKTAIKILFLLFFTLCGAITAQTVSDSSRALYEGKIHSYQFMAPEGWAVDIENAYEDGYTAAISPAGTFYSDAQMAIFIWVYPIDSISFEEFIRADSAYYAGNIDKLEFIGSDTLFNSDGVRMIVFQTADPGGVYDQAMVAYIDTESEVVIFELNIEYREQFAEAESKLREALRRFRYTNSR